MQQFSEIIKLAKARAEELSINKQVSRTNRIKNLIVQKKELESIYNKKCHDGVLDLLEELNSIKDQERVNGVKKNKTREYFKKGTWEYERKQYLKKEIDKYEQENPVLKSLKQKIAKLNQQKVNVETGYSMYDATLGALFVRVSDIMNELIAKARVSSKRNNQVDYSCISLKKQS